jgi:hypothetical protein
MVLDAWTATHRHERSAMDTVTLLLGIATLTLAGVTLHAWRLGNDKRDLALLGSLAGLSGLGTMTAAIV